MTRKCKNKCGTEIPLSAKSETTYHKAKFCGWDCMTEFGIAKARQAAEKKAARQDKAKHTEFKEMKERVDSQGTKSKLMVRAQAAFNAFIRGRDKKQPCISCNTAKVKTYHMASGWDAGHYRSRGANPELRFNEDNCFKQCVNCNRDVSGNVVNMRIGILKRIGKDRLDAIEGPHSAKKYTADELRSIATEYKAKLKDISN